MVEPIIAFDSVTHVYQQPGTPPFRSLHDISFQIPPGQSTAILGRSGSGKSTLLNLIAGIDRPCSGVVRVAGSDIAAMPESALAAWRGRHVGVIFQFFQLLPTLTVRENLLLAMEFVGTIPGVRRKARVEKLLEIVGIANEAGKLPAFLSGGQQQRAAIARALVNEPKVVIADEPTGNLDTDSATAVLDLFGDLQAQGVTLVTVTHDRAVASRAERMIHLDDGRLSSQRSTPDQTGRQR